MGLTAVGEQAGLVVGRLRLPRRGGGEPGLQGRDPRLEVLEPVVDAGQRNPTSLLSHFRAARTFAKKAGSVASFRMKS
ncbi:hypothetical protein PS9374_01605 [Planomonospora sphaerica]|uniref:Uncharacterized protein n=1 Tax=Planomonospora sphaerica TaxID=161355 RepID=A0A161LVM2_9ACTN|nr:hypothetical protein PS9374_01605 [Planomonospora sphaerica]